jgi:small subunit ribosomal protein S16
VAVKIKLKRLGKIRNPQYRIVVADARTKRDGRAIEEIGKYHPRQEPSLIEVNSERAQYWLSVGAQPTEPVLNLLKIIGDWQKFKGEPGAEGTLRVAAPKPNKKTVFEAAVKEAMKEDESAATTPKSRKKTESKKGDGKAESRKGDGKKGEQKKADSAAGESAKVKDDAAVEQPRAEGTTEAKSEA